MPRKIPPNQAARLDSGALSHSCEVAEDKILVSMDSENTHPRNHFLTFDGRSAIFAAFSCDFFIFVALGWPGGED